jgi:hypothetical protein
MTTEIGNSALLRTWANDGTVTVPSNTKIDEGWLRGEQPPHEWMNYIHNILGQKINHALSRGAADWVASTEYLAGAAVNRSGSLWLALATNTNSEPSGANSNWAQIANSENLATGTFATLSSTTSLTSPLLTNAGTLALSATGANVITASTNGSERLRVDSSGNVGIGTSSPAALLHVDGGLADYSPSASGTGLFHLTGGATSTYEFYVGVTDDGATIGHNGSGNRYLRFDTDDTERARIDASGRLMVGATSSSHRLKVSDQADRTQANAQFNIEGNAYSVFLFLDGTAAHLGQNSNARALRMYSGSNPAVGVNLAAGGNSWGTYSDERVKDIIEPIEGGIGKLSQLRTVIGRYKFDDADKRRVFLIAQDVKKVLPEAVTQDDSGDLSLQYQDLIPVLVKAIQEQQDIIKALEARVAALEGV